MNKLIILLLFLPLCSFGQIYNHDRVFNDTLKYKDFNQGFIDSQKFFIATNDYLLGVASTSVIGLASTAATGIPAVISFITPPKNSRLVNVNNPNNKYLDLNIDYYNGYKYGATKKKRKRLIQGSLTPVVVIGTVFIAVLSSY